MLVASSVAVSVGVSEDELVESCVALDVVTDDVDPSLVAGSVVCFVVVFWDMFAVVVGLQIALISST